MGQKAVTRNRTGNPAQLSYAWATSVKARRIAVIANQPNSVARLGSKERGGGIDTSRSGAGVLKSHAGIHPFILSAKSAALNVATNGCRERSNLPRPLHD